MREQHRELQNQLITDRMCSDHTNQLYRGKQHPLSPGTEGHRPA
ncbi:hypothetical protein KPATCC21470_0142 [Kitasatospora purpeofusca]